MLAGHTTAAASVPDPLPEGSASEVDGTLDYAPSQAEQATLAAFAAALDAAKRGRTDQALDALERSLEAAAEVEDDAVRQPIERRIKFEQARIRLSVADLTAEELRSIERSLESLLEGGANLSQQAAAREVLDNVRGRLRRLPSAPPPRLLPAMVQLSPGSVVTRNPPRLVVAGATVASVSTLGFAAAVAGAVLERRVVDDYANSPDRSHERSRRELRAARTAIAVGVASASALLITGLTVLAVGLARNRRN